MAEELAANAERMAVEVESVPEDGWARTASRPEGDVTALWMLRHAVHEGNHHLLDIGRVLRTVRERPS